jgi:hypothetical protein
VHQRFSTTPPVELAKTLVLKLQNYQRSWLVHWYFSTAPPVELAGTLVFL